MRKHRHYQRYKVAGNGHILSSKLQKAGVLVNDISASGVNLTTDLELEEHETVVIDITISGSFIPFSKQFKGKVIRKHSNNSLHHYAVKFIELTRKDLIEVDEYLRFNQSSSKLQPLGNEIGYDDIPSSG